MKEISRLNKIIEEQKIDDLELEMDILESDVSSLESELDKY